MKASIVVPLYNKAPWIGRCLDSIGEQSMTDYEVIVVDDGSDDGGDAIVSARADERVRLVRQPRGGEGAARNRGLAEARSEWVAFLDADDEWLPVFLERGLDAVSSHAGLVAGFTNLIDAGTGRPLLSSADSGVLDDYFAFVLANRCLGMTSSSTLVRREPFLSCGAFRVGVPVGADTDAWARLAWSGPVAYVGEPLAVYHPFLPGSATDIARKSKPQFPAIALSHAEWREAGRIPTRLAPSSSRLVQSFLLDHAIALANLGLRRNAWRVLRRECRAQHGAVGRYCGAYVRLLLPHPILRHLRGTARNPQAAPSDPGVSPVESQPPLRHDAP